MIVILEADMSKKTEICGLTIHPYCPRQCCSKEHLLV